jgi:N12 class adenine-specific DNA methylase
MATPRTAIAPAPRSTRHYDAFVEKFGPINKAEIQTRRPNIIQQESAAPRPARKRATPAPFDEGSSTRARCSRKGAASEIARARRRRARSGQGKRTSFDEGTFDPEEMPDIIIDKRPNVDPFMDDPESYRLRAIERYDEGPARPKRAGVLREHHHRTRAEIKSVNDALLYSAQPEAAGSTSMPSRTRRQEPRAR